MNYATRAERIRALNDAFRTGAIAGKILITQGILGLPDHLRAELLKKVTGPLEPRPGDDPYEEHDFGALMVEQHSIFWKIDYYDADYRFGADDPADPTTCRRVLTIMLAEEY